MKTGPLICAFMVFVLDVKVKAAEPVTLLEERNVIQEPANCLIESSICAVKTHHGRKYNLQVGAHAVVMEGDTVVLRTSDSSVRLIQGVIWLKPQGEFAVESLYGKAVSEGEEFWASMKSGKFLTRATFAPVRLFPRAGVQPVFLPPGYQNWLGPVTFDGTAAVGIPMALDFSDHLIQWARLYSGPKRDFSEKVIALRELWAEAVIAASDLHLSLVQRTIASEYEKNLRRAEARRLREAEDAKLRVLFRQKNFLE